VLLILFLLVLFGFGWVIQVGIALWMVGMAGLAVVGVVMWLCRSVAGDFRL
jgi:hypothetical protein